MEEFYEIGNLVSVIGIFCVCGCGGIFYSGDQETLNYTAEVFYKIGWIGFGFVFKHSNNHNNRPLNKKQTTNLATIHKPNPKPNNKNVPTCRSITIQTRLIYLNGSLKNEPENRNPDLFSREKSYQIRRDYTWVSVQYLEFEEYCCVIISVLLFLFLCMWGRFIGVIYVVYICQQLYLFLLFFIKATFTKMGACVGAKPGEKIKVKQQSVPQEAVAGNPSL